MTLEEKLVAAVRRGVVREDSLCRMFSGWGSIYHEPTEDALFKLVEKGVLEWGEDFLLEGDLGYKAEILTYRIP